MENISGISLRKIRKNTVGVMYIVWDIFLRCCHNGRRYTHLWCAYGYGFSKTSFFFNGEGPRSRRYGRTAAMRLIVQPCDEDGDDDYYFLSFS
jgi:hypothetical protein